MSEKHSRIIMHLDMDCFFAAVEELKNPSIKGKPVVVGANPKGGFGRGAVSTCNYEARKFGLHSGMAISKAWQLCPHAVYLEPDFGAYLQSSSKVMAIIKKHFPLMEQVSIDEAYMDASFCDSYEDVLTLASDIRSEVYAKCRLTCSIGIGPNKLVAKIATEMKKPAGITVIREKDVQQKLWPLPASKLPGIGKRTAQVLSGMGIRTIGGLANSEVGTLIDIFGKAGYDLHLMARGIDERVVEEIEGPKSISRETTFEEDVKDREILIKEIELLCRQVHETVLQEGYFFKNVSIKIRFSTFETHTKSKTIKTSAGLESLQQAAIELFSPFLSQSKWIRLIGLRVGGLVEREGVRTLGEFVQKV